MRRYFSLLSTRRIFCLIEKVKSLISFPTDGHVLLSLFILWLYLTKLYMIAFFFSSHRHHSDDDDKKGVLLLTATSQYSDFFLRFRSKFFSSSSPSSQFHSLDFFFFFSTNEVKCVQCQDDRLDALNQDNSDVMIVKEYDKCSNNGHYHYTK